MDRNTRGKSGRQYPRSTREEWLLHFHDQISSFPESMKHLKGKETVRELFIPFRRREDELVRTGTCSFSGASHPAEPVDADLMRPVCFKLDLLKEREVPNPPSSSSASSSPFYCGHGSSAKDLSITIRDHDVPNLLPSSSSSITTTTTSSFVCGHGSVAKDLPIMIKEHDLPKAPPSSSSSTFSFLGGRGSSGKDLSMIKEHDVPYPPSSSLSSSPSAASPVHCGNGSSAEDLSIMNVQSSSSSSFLCGHGSRAEDVSTMIHHHEKPSAPSSTSTSPPRGQDSERNNCIWDSSPSPLKSQRLPRKPIRGIESWESEKTSLSSTFSDDSTWSSDPTVIGNIKPHRGNDLRWKAVLAVRSRDGTIGMGHFRLIQRLGCGDIGSVYLSELSGTRCSFAVKVMDKVSLETRKKMARAKTEREILECLDHPFLPTLYSHFETDRFSCLVMEYCPGGDLHTLRQRQQGKRFSEFAARWFLSLNLSYSLSAGLSRVISVLVLRLTLCRSLSLSVSRSIRHSVLSHLIFHHLLSHPFFLFYLSLFALSLSPVLCRLLCQVGLIL